MTHFLMNGGIILFVIFLLVYIALLIVLPAKRIYDQEKFLRE
jgi:hypothetical protein